MSILRSCPHCKSTSGFELDYSVNGYGKIKMDFQGNELDHERTTFDDTSLTACCISCGRSIKTDNLQIEAS